MNISYTIGDTVSWKKEDSTAVGKIIKIYGAHISKAIRVTGSTGRDDGKAYLIEEQNGDDEVLKLSSEICPTEL